MNTIAVLILLAFTGLSAVAQEAAPGETKEGTGVVAPVPDETSTAQSSETTSSAETKVKEIAAKAQDLAGKAEAKVDELAAKVDQDERAKKAMEGLLGKIYLLAESLNFSSFHWLAFALMATGVVSFALQLVLGKLVLLFHGSLNVREICSDSVGFVISTVGLVLTTQAAAENSEFTHSPAAVLSAALFGIVVGFTLYRWGQRQEIQAVKSQDKS